MLGRRVAKAPDRPSGCARPDGDDPSEPVPSHARQRDADRTVCGEQVQVDGAFEKSFIAFVHVRVARRMPAYGGHQDVYALEPCEGQLHSSSRFFGLGRVGDHRRGSPAASKCCMGRRTGRCRSSSSRRPSMSSALPSPKTNLGNPKILRRLSLGLIPVAPPLNLSFSLVTTFRSVT